MIDVPTLFAFSWSFLDALNNINPFMAVVVIAFVVGVVAPWMMWSIWIGPRKGGSKKALRVAERESERLLIDLKNRQADNDNLRQQQHTLAHELEESREE